VTVRRWLDQAAEHGAADLDFSAVVATILGPPGPAMSGGLLECAGAAQAQASGTCDQMAIRRIGLVVNDAKSGAVEAAHIVRAWAAEHGVPCIDIDVWEHLDGCAGMTDSQVAASAGDPDLIVTLGGDGTLLRGVAWQLPSTHWCWAWTSAGSGSSCVSACVMTGAAARFLAGGSGLVGLKERVEALGGQNSLQSAPV